MGDPCLKTGRVRKLPNHRARVNTNGRCAFRGITFLDSSFQAIVEARGVPGSYYEYAMLYGIQTGLQRRLVGEGRRVRILISYGEQWFAWYMRRLAERPANIWFVLKNVFR